LSACTLRPLDVGPFFGRKLSRRVSSIAHLRNAAVKPPSVTLKCAANRTWIKLGEKSAEQHGGCASNGTSGAPYFAASQPASVQWCRTAGEANVVRKARACVGSVLLVGTAPE
jgi:hypothetical protein